MKRPTKKKPAPTEPTREELLEQVERMRTMLRQTYREMTQLYADLDPILKRDPVMLSRHPNAFASAVVAVAESEWIADIRDDDSGAVLIDEYIRGEHGLGWGSADVRNLSERRAYQPQSFSWCGAFVAYCYGLGAEMTARARKYTLPSCSRLWRDWGGTARLMGGSMPEKMIPAIWPQAGDIVTVQNAGSVAREQGSHIVLCVDVDTKGGTFATIEGNAWGYFPDGTRGEGVVRNSRAVTSIAKIYRPVATDFDQ